MKVVLLGKLADIAGWREREMQAATAPALVAVLAAENPDLGAALRQPGVRMAVDHAISSGADLAGAREVAFLPIMSGG